MRKFKWSNIPIPEGHVTTLVVGVALHVWHPLEFWQAALQIQAIGWTLLMMGILLALWATATFDEMDFEKQTAIITTGPYAFSRNPMYVAWTLIYLAITLLVKTWWLIMLLPLVLLFTHFFVIRKKNVNWNSSSAQSIATIAGECGDICSNRCLPIQELMAFGLNRAMSALS